LAAEHLLSIVAGSSVAALAVPLGRSSFLAAPT